MPWDDFVSEFTDLSINHLINTSLFSFSKTWQEFTKVDHWEWLGGLIIVLVIVLNS